MAEQSVGQPGPDQPIRVLANPNRIILSSGTIAHRSAGVGGGGRRSVDAVRKHEIHDEVGAA